MHRSHGVKYSQESVMRARFFARSSSAWRRSGTLPVGGSTTMDRRGALLLTFVSENSGDGLGPCIVRFGASMPGNHQASALRRAASSGLGASSGVLSKFTHVPCRSGWPSGMRGTSRADDVWLVAPADCPPTPTGVAVTTAPAAATAPDDASNGGT